MLVKWLKIKKNRCNKVKETVWKIWRQNIFNGPLKYIVFYNFLSAIKKLTIYLFLKVTA